MPTLDFSVLTTSCKSRETVSEGQVDKSPGGSIMLVLAADDDDEGHWYFWNALIDPSFRPEPYFEVIDTFQCLIRHAGLWSAIVPACPAI